MLHLPQKSSWRPPNSIVAGLQQTSLDVPHMLRHAKAPGAHSTQSSPDKVLQELHLPRKSTQLQVALLLQFWTFNLHVVRKVCSGHLKIAILLQFLTFNAHFVRKGCSGQIKIAILPRFCASTSISWRHCSILRENNKKRERQRKRKRERERGRERRSADVKV